jgi:hypothetical protein
MDHRELDWAHTVKLAMILTVDLGVATRQIFQAERYVFAVDYYHHQRKFVKKSPTSWLSGAEQKKNGARSGRLRQALEGRLAGILCRRWRECH